MAPAAEEVDVRQSCWDPMEVHLVKEVNAGAASLRKGHSSSGTCSIFVLHEAWPSTVLVVSGFEDAFFSFIGHRLEGCCHILHITSIDACHIY